MISEFQKLDKAQQTPEKLAEIVNASSDFTITPEQAERVLASKPNPYRLASHKYLSEENVPAINDFDAFSHTTIAETCWLESKRPNKIQCGERVHTRIRRSMYSLGDLRGPSCQYQRSCITHNWANTSFNKLNNFRSALTFIF